MTVALCIGAIACLGLAHDVSGMFAKTVTGPLAVVMVGTVWIPALAAACYLLTLATGWRP